jgi:hypothetical protein
VDVGIRSWGPHLHALTPYVIHDPADLTRVLEAKIRNRREFIRLYGTREERLRIGPLGIPPAPGMLERINRAVRALDGGEVLTLRKTP